MVCALHAANPGQVRFAAGSARVAGDVTTAVYHSGFNNTPCPGASQAYSPS